MKFSPARDSKRPTANDIIKRVKKVGHSQLWNIHSRDHDTTERLRNADIMKAYSEKTCQKATKGYETWIDCLFPEDRCTTSFIYAGIGSVYYPTNFKILKPYMLRKLTKYVDIESRLLRGQACRLATADSICVDYFMECVQSLWKESCSTPIIFIPWFLTNEGHWGCIIAVPPNQEKMGCVWWGDSLNIRPQSELIFSVVKEAMNKLEVMDVDQRKWEISKPSQNFMTTVLDYPKQQNAYSSGFYVIAAAWSFSLQKPCFAFREESVGDGTESVRTSCIQTFLSAVLQLYYEDDRIAKTSKPRQSPTITFDDNTTADLLAEVINGTKLLKRCPAPLSKLNRNTPKRLSVGTPWTETRLNEVGNLKLWMEGLNKSGFYMGKVEFRPIKRKISRTRNFSHTFTTRCVEYRRIYKCPAKIIGKKNTCSGLWEIRYEGTHNHELLSPMRKSHMHNYLLTDLSKL